MSAKIVIINDLTCENFILKRMSSENSIHNMHADPELVILDLNTPDADEFQILSALKSDERYKNLRTIILNNYDELDNEIKGFIPDAIEYIRKPVHMDSLKTRVEMHIELLRMQRHFEHRMLEQGLTFDAIFKQAPIGIAISSSSDPFYTRNPELLIVNPVYKQIIGRTKEELNKLGWAKITHPDDLEEDIKNFRRLQSGEVSSYAMEKRYIRPDGSIVWVDMLVASITLSDKHKNSHICLIQDITERKTLEKVLLESERSKSVLLANLPGMAYRCNYDSNWTMQFVSDGCFQLTGYNPESLLFNKEICFNDLIVPEYQKPLWSEWERILVSRLPFKYEYEIETARGERKWVLEMGQGVYNEQGDIEALEGIIFDISDRKEIENNLRYNNEHDLWTGLYNRRYLENLLDRDAKIEGYSKRAVIGINLSSVHRLSLVYGFSYSQELIKKAVTALNELCTERCQLFHTYENQFVFYMKDYTDKNELSVFCQNVVNSLEPVFVAGRIGVGIGIVEIDEEQKHEIEQLFKNLLIATEKALNIFGEDVSFCFFDRDMEAQIIREEDIKHELEMIGTDDNNGGLFLQFQPILDIKSNKIAAFEALARIKSDKLGLISPLEFIPIAEKTKLIIPVGQKVILQAFNFINKLKDNGYEGICVSINISAIQLHDRDFNENLFNMIKDMRINPSNISLEITESIFADNYQEINRILGELKDFGILIAIDDFGTGYSSLARERELNVGSIKIDKSFVDKLVFLKDEEAITGDIISMAHKLGHCVVAEGVENEKQLQYLKENGCDKIQGYLISRPLDEEAAIEFLKKPTLCGGFCSPYRQAHRIHRGKTYPAANRHP